MDTIQMNKRELEDIIATASEMGFCRALFLMGKTPRVVSENRAHKQFCKARVQTWVKDGKITCTTNGNGVTSTKYYDYEKLLKLDVSDNVIIHKAYVSKKKQ